MGFITQNIQLMFKFLKLGHWAGKFRMSVDFAVRYSDDPRLHQWIRDAYETFTKLRDANADHAAWSADDAVRITLQLTSISSIVADRQLATMLQAMHTYFTERSLER